MSAPRIRFSSGLQIGYETALASFGRPVELCGGTHYLLARNGRGKTTLLRTVAGTLKPRDGEVVREGFLQYLPEDLRFDGEISAEMIFRMLLPKARFKAALDLAREIELDVRKPYGRLSTGNRRKTSLIVAEFSTREDRGNILLLDEPFSGLDAFARSAFEEIWKKSAENVLRLVSCHPDYDSMVMDSALLIESGRVTHHQSGGQTWNVLKELLN
ncbi:MAG: ATP-binding cassette domain-containing protein [Luteolibacter sp.]